MSKDNVDKKSILQRDLNTKEMLVAIGICGVVFAYGYMCIYPQYKDYQSKVSTLKGINAEITKYEDGISELPIKKEKLDNLNKEIKIKSRMLSHNMEDGMFLIGLSKLMKEVNVDLLDYSMDEVVPYETFYAIPTSISVRGDYRHVREIMYYLEEQKNMTQTLDYSMTTYIPKEEENKSNSNNDSVIIPDSIVYWTTKGLSYHKEGCTILEEEKVLSGYKYSSGSATQSGKNTACQVCKPYTTQISNQPQEEPEKPKSNGTVEATFKFIMYSSENPVLDLENDDSSKWKPGKYNPFTTTSR
ncbi:hypothetical protein [Romboutsia sp.]|uniref:hypothetical protein n=1 Tax=Romboutsia sp. TaxID=1965302 RepID=UPI003F2E15F8